MHIHYLEWKEKKQREATKRQIAKTSDACEKMREAKNHPYLPSNTSHPTEAYFFSLAGTLEFGGCWDWCFHMRQYAYAGTFVQLQII